MSVQEEQNVKRRRGMRDKRAEMIKLSKNDVVASRDSDHQAQSSAAILLCFQYVQHTAPVVQ